VRQPSPFQQGLVADARQTAPHVLPREGTHNPEPHQVGKVGGLQYGNGVKAVALVLGQIVTQCIVQVVLVSNGLVGIGDKGHRQRQPLFEARLDALAEPTGGSLAAQSFDVQMRVGQAEGEQPIGPPLMQNHPGQNTLVLSRM